MTRAIEPQIHYLQRGYRARVSNYHQQTSTSQTQGTFSSDLRPRPPAGCDPGSPGSEAITFASADQAHEPWLYWRGESCLPNSNCPEILVRYMPPEPSAVYSMKKVPLRTSYQLNQLEASPSLTSASLGGIDGAMLALEGKQLSLVTTCPSSGSGPIG